MTNVTRPLYNLPWADKKRIAFRHDSHFSPFGHQQVAGVLANVIRSRGLLRGKASGEAAPPHVTTSHAAPAVRPAAHPAARPAEGTYILGISAFYHDFGSSAHQGRRNRRRRRGGALLAREERPALPRPGRQLLSRRGRHRSERPRRHCLLRQRAAHLRAPAALDRGGGAEGQKSGAASSQPGSATNCTSLSSSGRSWSTTASSSTSRTTAPTRQARSMRLPSTRAAIVTLDGVGEWATGSIGFGAGARRHHPQGNALPQLDWPPLLGIHPVHRFQGQLRRIQDDGTRALRRGEIRRRILRPPRRASKRTAPSSSTWSTSRSFHSRR